MKFDPKISAFGRHETFPLRYGWLTKVIKSINKQGITAIFKQPEEGMTNLGLGKNIVNALQYWLQVTNFQPTRGLSIWLASFARQSGRTQLL